MRQSARLVQQGAALQPAPDAPAPINNVLLLPRNVPVPVGMVNFRGTDIPRAAVEVRISADAYTTVHALDNTPQNSRSRLLAVYSGCV